MDLVTVTIFLLISTIAIGKGSDWFTDSLIPIARKLGVSGVSVGLILVSVAVSLPEVLVAGYGALKGHPNLSLGVALGSIICNIGLMTGISALVKPLKIHTYVILRDGVFSVVVPILVFAVASGGELTRFEGLAFMLLFIPYVINVFLQEKLTSKSQKQKDYKNVEIKLELLGFDIGKLKSGWLSFSLGIALLLFGAQFFTNTIIQIVNKFPVDELIIGL